MGKLFVVPTPNWQLGGYYPKSDLGCFKECDLILAEDTRTSGVLLKRYEVETANAVAPHV